MKLNRAEVDRHADLTKARFGPAREHAAGGFHTLNGDPNVAKLQGYTIALYNELEKISGQACGLHRSGGLILADTKLEFGVDPATGQITLGDEVLTPDSSRYWPADSYAEGSNPPSFDKQFLRDWLETAQVQGKPWSKSPPAPHLPQEVIAQTAAKYQEAWERLKD